MKVSCLVITTTISSRFDLLSNTIDSIEEHGAGILDQKVLSIDIVEGHPYNKEDFYVYEDLGWFLVIGACSGRRGMANNILRGLANIDGDILFYCEDDVIINKIPSRETLELLFLDFNNPLGCIVYNTHAHNLWDTDERSKYLKKQYINDSDNYFGIDTDDFFLVKEYPIRDEYLICFPAAIMMVDKFRSCLKYACENCVGMGMEPGMTKAWTDLGFVHQYPVVMYVSKTILPNTEEDSIDFQDLYNRANMQFWNNDETLRHPSINQRQNTIF